MQVEHEYTHRRIVLDEIRVVVLKKGTWTVTVNGIRVHHADSKQAAIDWAKLHYADNT